MKAAEGDELISLFAASRYDDAEALSRRLIQESPSNGTAWKVLGSVLAVKGQLGDAEAALRTAGQLLPSDPHVLDNLGIVLARNGRPGEGIRYVSRAIELAPDYYPAQFHLANIRLDIGQLAGAEADYRKTLQLNPDFAPAHYNLGNLLMALGRLTEAEACYAEAARLGPEFHLAHLNHGNALKDLGRYAEAERSYRRAIVAKPDFAMAYSNLLFMINYDPGRSEEQIISAYKSFDSVFGLPLRAEWRSHENDRNPARRLRVGYVSPDFCAHSAMLFLEPLLASHDRRAVELIAYAEVAREDEVTARFRKYVEHWVPTIGLTDAQLAERIRADRVDILVDMAGHTLGNRLPVFARKPAPVAVSSTLGFACTTGLSAIDWFLTDAVATPPGSEHLFSEKIWRVGQCLAYRPKNGMGPVSRLPALEQGFITFGTLTRRLRINERVISVWAEILRRIPKARLRIDSRDFVGEQLCADMAARFAALGIGRERLVLGYHSPPWDVLRGLDITLDCFPHNSGTTLYESLYMGVPVITLAGRPSVGRLGASIVTHLGHPEWVATSEQEYVNKAIALANDRPRLSALRDSLRPEMEASALMDEKRYAAQVEAAYRDMWRQWCASR